MNYFCSFSEAIRAGATIRPQGFGSYFDDGKTCADGAGVEAMFGFSESVDGAREAFRYLADPSGPCPECGLPMNYAVVSAMIYHLNDDHRWTREAIADWLESYEESIGYVTIAETEPTNASINKLAFV